MEDLPKATQLVSDIRARTSIMYLNPFIFFFMYHTTKLCSDEIFNGLTSVIIDTRLGRGDGGT